MKNEDNLDTLIGKAKSYIDSSILLVQLKASAHLSNLLSSLLANMLTWVALLFFILFLSVSAALYLSQLFESKYIGFLLVASFYFVLCLLLKASKKNRIQNYCRDRIVVAMLGTEPRK